MALTEAEAKLVAAVRAAGQIVSEGQDAQGIRYTDLGKLNQAAWIGERWRLLLAIIDRLAAEVPGGE